MPNQTVLILGGSGQDGAFLAQRYLNEGFQVVSVSRRESLRLNRLGVIQFKRDFLLDSDILDILLDFDPDIVVNLSSISSVAYCELNPQISEKINFVAVKNFVNSIVMYSEVRSKNLSFIQASSSEMFGDTNEFCDELTVMNPITIYGKHKLLSHELVLNDKYKEFDFKSIILFNHESEFRGPEFVSYKVSRAAAEVHAFGSTQIEFGNLSNKRDWGFAGDYMDAFLDISIKGKGSSYVVASGELHSIANMLTEAFAVVKIPNFQDFIQMNEKFFRKTETPPIKGNARKCFLELGWSPKISFVQLIERLVKNQINEISGNNNV